VGHRKNPLFSRVIGWVGKRAEGVHAHLGSTPIHRDANARARTSWVHSTSPGRSRKKNRDTPGLKRRSRRGTWTRASGLESTRTTASGGDKHRRSEVTPRRGGAVRRPPRRLRCLSNVDAHGVPVSIGDVREETLSFLRKICCVRSPSRGSKCIQGPGRVLLASRQSAIGCSRSCLLAQRSSCSLLSTQPSAAHDVTVRAAWVARHLRVWVRRLRLLRVPPAAIASRR
jgi:hypothetical protein